MPVRFDIREDDPARPEIVALLRAHLADVALHSPPESIHALDHDSLRAPNITFWSVREDGVLVGCAALKTLDATHAEIKSMRTAFSHLRRGVASALLDHILAVARQRGYGQVSLETGSMAAFAPARALYQRFGFEPCPPFADYIDDPNSVYMTRGL